MIPGIRQSRLWGWAIVVLAGLIDAWDSRFVMVPDGISYLDMAHSMVKGEWANAVNSYFGHLYPLLLAGFIYVLRPTSYWEVPVTHLVNFVIYLGCFAACEFFMAQSFLQFDESIQKHRRLLYWFGVGLFLWCSLRAISLENLTPDLCVMLASLMTASFLIRIQSNQAGMLWFVGLGMTLGLGYAAKAFLLPLGIVAILIVWWNQRSSPTVIKKLCVCVALFSLISLPQIFVISKKIGHLSFGETGRLNYFWAVDKISFFEPPGKQPGDFQSPSPVVEYQKNELYFEEAAPGATIPLWNDPGATWKGFQGYVNLPNQGPILLGNFAELIGYFLNFDWLPFLCVLIVTLLLGREKLRRLFCDPVVVYSGIALLAYLPIYFLPRYSAPFFIVITFRLVGMCAEELETIRLDQIFRVLTLASLIVLWVRLCDLEGLHQFRRVILDCVSSGRAIHKTSQNTDWEIAQEMSRHGVLAGDRLGLVGYPPHSFWAEVIHTPIVAWQRQPDFTPFFPEEASRFMREHGIKYFISPERPPRGLTDNWVALGDTGFYLFAVK